ncbi:MAG: HAMP domain-containing histidine kinase, partial [Verrucomicrobia bacterium]|nr:HAMP domain-containing histidine kinase [Cytophagales bacterium]
LKSPLNSIKGIMQLFEMENDNLTDEQKEYLRYISSASTRLFNLITDILNVNRIETGKTDLRLEKFNIFHFIEDLVFGLKISADKKNIKIFLESNCKNLEFVSDKSMLAQVMENLISNAIKFSPLGKKIIVWVMKEGDLLRLEVEDEGPGIISEELPLLFDKFKRLSTRPTAGEDSTGLGLSIVKGLIENLQGEISVDSEVGKGSKFTVNFPLPVIIEV